MYDSDVRHSSPDLEYKLNRLYNLNRHKKIDLSFRPPYLNLLAAFGNPHMKLPPVLHVAGTNGKGSVVAALKAMLEAGGYKVHAYTSPHLVEFNERICLAGRNIKNCALEELIDRAIVLNGDAQCTFFEITTAMAFAAFAETPADILLLETGLGGRLDCTNVIEQPAATIITAIGYDHMEHLGDNLCAIAGEKVGIIKYGVPCVISAQTPQAVQEGVMDVILNRCAAMRAPVIAAGAGWFTQPHSGKFRFGYKYGDDSVETDLPLPNLPGAHQIGNCGAALAALRIIRGQFPVAQNMIEQGLQNIYWPGRLQNLTSCFTAILPSDWEIWLDGAHNENAAKALSTHVEKWRAKDMKPLHLIMGMLSHKDAGALLHPLLPYTSTLNLVDIPGEPKAIRASALARQINQSMDAQVYENYTEAIKHLVKNLPSPGRILITGSLYLAGHVLKTAQQPS